MPFLLENLPPEALSIITSFLHDAETISRLCATGNRHLMRRITNGGVLSIHLTEKEPMGRIFRFVSTLCLISVSIDHFLGDKPLQTLIRALPSTSTMLKSRDQNLRKAPHNST